MKPVRVSPRVVYGIYTEILAKKKKPSTPVRVVFVDAVILAVVGGIAMVLGAPTWAFPAVLFGGMAAIFIRTYVAVRRVLRQIVAAAVTKAEVVERVSAEELVKAHAYLAIFGSAHSPEALTEMREEVERYEIASTLRGIEAREKAAATENFVAGRIDSLSS